MNKVVYIKQNNYRKAEYNIVSTIEIDSEGKKYVVKTAKNKNGISFLNSFYEKYEYLCEIYKDTNLIILKPNKISDSQLSFEYLEYKNFENILIEDIKNDDFAEFEKKGAEFYKLLFSAKPSKIKYNKLESYEQFFDKVVNLAEGTPLIDINFDNFLVNNGKFYLVDYEWTFDSNFEPNFLKDRTIFYFLKRNQNTLDINKLITKLRISQTSIQEILNFESNFIKNLTTQENQQKIKLTQELDNIFNNPININPSIPNLSKEIDKLKLKNSESEQRFENLNYDLKGIENSLTWKLTKPLRSLPFKRPR